MPCGMPCCLLLCASKSLFSIFFFTSHTRLVVWSLFFDPLMWKAAICMDHLCLLSSRVNELYVDDPDKDSGGKIEVNLNISLPNLHCECEYLLSLTCFNSYLNRPEFVHCPLCNRMSHHCSLCQYPITSYSRRGQATSFPGPCALTAACVSD